MRSRALYTPPVTPRKSATPEASELTERKSEVRSKKSEISEEIGNANFNQRSDLLHPISDFCSEAAVEGGVGDWGEVVTRYPYRKVRMDHLLSKETRYTLGIS